MVTALFTIMGTKIFGQICILFGMVMCKPHMPSPLTTSVYPPFFMSFYVVLRVGEGELQGICKKIALLHDGMLK